MVQPHKTQQTACRHLHVESNFVVGSMFGTIRFALNHGKGAGEVSAAAGVHEQTFRMLVTSQTLAKKTSLLAVMYLQLKHLCSSGAAWLCECMCL